MPPLADDELAAYIQLLSDARNAKGVALVAFTCLLWHHITTLPEEIRFIWARRSWLNGSLFVGLRYLTLVSFIVRIFSLFHYSPSPSFCHNSAMFTGSSSLIVIAICDVFLLIRVWAIYERRRLILILLFLGFVGTITPMFILGAKWLHSISLSHIVSPQAVEGCFFDSPMVRRYWEIFPFTIGFNSVLLAMTVYKAWGHHKLEAGTPISTLLLRDGALSYLLVLVALLLTGCGVLIPRFQMIALQSGFASAVITIICSQMQLNIRSVLGQNYICTSSHFYPCSCIDTQGRLDTTDSNSHISFIMPYSCSGCTSARYGGNAGERRQSRHRSECQERRDSTRSEAEQNRPDSLATVRWDGMSNVKGDKFDNLDTRCTSMLVSSTACQSSSAHDPSPRPLGRMNSVPNGTTRGALFDTILPLYRSSSFSGSVRPPSTARLSSTIRTSSNIGVDSATTLVAPTTSGRRGTLQSRLDERTATGTAYYLQSLPLPIYSQGFMGPVGFSGCKKPKKTIP